MNRIAAAMAYVALSGFAGCGDDSSTTGTDITAPSGLTAVERDGGAHLTWKDNSSNEAEFVIERKMGSGDWTELATVPFNTMQSELQYHDATLTPGTTYVYRVKAALEGGDGAYSNEVTFTAPSDGSAGAGGSSGSGSSGAGGSSSNAGSGGVADAGTAGGGHMVGGAGGH